MRWSWMLGRVRGIAIHVHATFLILLAWVAWVEVALGGGTSQAIGAVLLVIAVFGTVILHELAHALVARHFGFRTRDITLYPIGGLSRLERMPDEPWQEFLVSIAGPIVNFVVAAAILTGLLVTNEFHVPRPVDVLVEPFLARLMWVNIVIGAFNLIPAFPMDGGRILRATLATVLDHETATHVAATLGQALAIALGVLGIFTNPFLVAIAIFIFLGASSEEAAAQLRYKLDHVAVSSVMITDYRALHPDDPLSVAVAHTLSSFQQDFPVVGDGGHCVGVLGRRDLVKGLSESGQEAHVDQVMHRDVLPLAPNELVEPNLSRLQESPGCVPVVSDDHLVGVVTLENVGEYLAFTAAMRARSAA